MIADDRIVGLVRPSIMDCIPSFIKRHVIDKNCRQIEKEFPELYSAFLQEEEPTEGETIKMSEIVNAIFEEQILERQGR